MDFEWRVSFSVKIFFFVYIFLDYDSERRMSLKKTTCSYVKKWNLDQFWYCNILLGLCSFIFYLFTCCCYIPVLKWCNIIIIIFFLISKFLWWKWIHLFILIIITLVVFWNISHVKMIGMVCTRKYCKLCVFFFFNTINFLVNFILF